MTLQCSCYCDESPQFYCERTVTARKAHVCEECGEQIQPGEKYITGSGKFDGVFFTRKVCLQCEQLGQNFGCYCLGALYDEILEWALEAGSDLPPELFDGLSAAGAAKLERLVLNKLEATCS